MELSEGPFLPSGEEIGSAGSCQGLSSIFTMTNPVSGINRTDGLMFRMSGLNFVMDNQEDKQIRVQTGGISLNLYGQFNQLWIGNRVNFPGATCARINTHIVGDNGMYIRTQSSGKYGLTIRSAAATDISLQVLGGGDTKNFVIQSNGFVFARKYITALASIPDYVFQPDYDLMPLSDLQTYIAKNQHLPNIPSAKEYSETGVDLGELNRLLLEISRGIDLVYFAAGRKNS